MGALTVRKLDDEIIRALKIRAAEKGVSAEAEHRAILRQALLGEAPTQSFADFLLTMPCVGEDADFEVDRDVGGRATPVETE